MFGEGKSRIPIDEFYALKQEIGKQGKWNFNSTNAEKTLAHAYEDVYKLMNDNMDEVLKSHGFDQFRQLNNQVHNAMNAERFLERVTNNVPSTSAGLNIKDMLAGGAGLAASGNPVGAVTGVAANKLLTSPEATQTFGKGLGKLGEILSSAKNIDVPSTAMNVGARAIPALLSTPNVKNNVKGNANQQQYNMQTNTPPPEPSITQGSRGIKITPEMLRDAYLMLPKGQADRLAAAYEAQNMGRLKPGTEAYVARENTKELTNMAYQALKNNPNLEVGLLSGPLTQLKAKLGLADQSSLDFNTVVSNLQATIAKARGGTSFTPNEQAMLDRYTPKVGDSKQELETKLRKLQDIFAD